MKFSLSLIMEGAFPGAPDRDTIEISEADYDELWARFVKSKATKKGWVGE